MASTPSRRSLVAGSAAAALGAPLLTAATAPAAAAADSSGRQVVPGADRAAAAGWRQLRGRKLGVISNPTGVLLDARHIVDSMAEHKELDIKGVFGPEHGFRGSAQAGESEPEFEDPRTGLTVYDAYGADAAKLAELFTKAGVDTIVFDIQDVGVRFYTYIWTMYHAMVAARSTDATFVVLDRPNPIGRRVDGPLLKSGYSSGVGLKPIVQQHGMTVGELAQFFNGELLPHEGGDGKGGKVDLEVVPVQGWNPRSHAQDTGLPWVPPSPNMPTPDIASCYAGTGYFEGTNLSEGRGTTQPFQLIGAPYLDHRYSDRLAARRLPGVRFREGYFVPTSDAYKDETCAGVQMLITDPSRFEAVPTAVAMLVEAAAYDGFAWRKDSDDQKRPYFIDKLSGSSRLREMVDAGEDTDAITAAWKGEVRDFTRQRRQYLIYG